MPESSSATDNTLATLISAVEQLWTSILKHLPQVLIALTVVLLTALVVRISQSALKRVLHRTKLRRSLADLFAQLAKIVAWLIGLAIAAMIAFPGFSFSQVLATAGLASVAIGFAFKDIFENFFAGILLLWNFPFEPGDYIEIEDQSLMGQVEEIWIRMTLLRMVTGELLTVPNSILYKSPVRILTCESTRRIQVVVGVAYGEDVDEAREVIASAVKGCTSVSLSPDPQIFAKAFGSSSIDFEVAWWTGSTPLQARKSRDEVVAAIKRALDEAGIEIPFPYRTLTFKRDEPLRALIQSSPEGE